MTLEQLVAETHVEMAQRLRPLFAAQAMIDAIGADRARQLTTYLLRAETPDLSVVAHEVRKAIVERRPANPLPELCLWRIIDAIGFLYDCSDERWKYMTNEGRVRRIVWAREELDQIELAVAQVGQELKPAVA